MNAQTKEKNPPVNIVRVKGIFSYCSADLKHVRNVKGQERSFNPSAFSID